MAYLTILVCVHVLIVSGPLLSKLTLGITAMVSQ